MKDQKYIDAFPSQLIDETLFNRDGFIGALPERHPDSVIDYNPSNSTRYWYIQLMACDDFISLREIQFGIAIERYKMPDVDFDFLDLCIHVKAKRMDGVYPPPKNDIQL